MLPYLIITKDFKILTLKKQCPKDYTFRKLSSQKSTEGVLLLHYEGKSLYFEIAYKMIYPVLYGVVTILSPL